MYNLAIIGGGPAGYNAAAQAARGGMNVVLFEKKALGGTCLNVGCIPTKTLLYSSKMYKHAAEGAKYGVKAEGVTFEYDKIVARKNKIIRKLVAGIKSKMTNNNVTVVTGEASVLSNDGKVVRIACADQQYEAERLLICTGSVVAIPPIPGVDTAEYWTSTEALETKEVPESLVVIGGGVIGIEFAGLFNTFGTKVTVVEMAPEILPGIDTEISAMLREDLTKKGVEFHLSSKVLHVATGCVTYSDAEGEHKAEATNILLCVGRKPSLDGVREMGLEPNRNGIKTDGHMRTSAPNVWAAGDINATSLLAHTAEREAQVAVNDMLGIEDEMCYNAIPGVIYTNPEVAGAGMSEAAAQAAGIEYKVRRLPMTFSGRFVAENEGGNGICKIITDAQDKVIGVHAIGNPCSEFICAACVAIEAGMTAEQLHRVVFPHPTVAEILKETAAE
ncbi:MAG: dihydrolipoyl dehydrogenase [bacterium]|nr:dihydrolipoyl dehydrogenase [Candidatus Colousia faecequi]